jgi:hypothetical protein
MAALPRGVCKHLEALTAKVKKENMHMLHKKHESSGYAKLAGVIAVALVLGVLIFGGYAAALPKPGGVPPAAPNKDKDKQFTQVYQHSYDEVFQASQEAIERMGCFVTNADKDKGVISGNGRCARGAPGYMFKVDFEIRIESVSTKPETRVTVNAQSKGWGRGAIKENFKDDFSRELQKVLSTYH